MSRAISVDNEVYAFIQQHAEPLVDTPNRVLRRLFNLGNNHPPKKSVTAVLAALSAATAETTATETTATEMTATEVAAVTEVARSTASAALITLERQGLARRTRGKRGPDGTPDTWQAIHPDR